MVDILSLDKAQLEDFFGTATREAISKIHAAGLPSTHGDDKGVYRLHPDGRKEYIKLYSVHGAGKGPSTGDDT